MSHVENIVLSLVNPTSSPSGSFLVRRNPGIFYFHKFYHIKPSVIYDLSLGISFGKDLPKLLVPDSKLRKLILEKLICWKLFEEVIQKSKRHTVE